MKEAFVGFDSAWGGKTKGAISYAVFQGDALEKEGMPQLVSFSEAAQIVNDLWHECDDVLVAIDQPTIVPNQTGSRPVDGVPRPLMGQLRSAVQPANRSKAALFGDEAPIWKFISDIGLSAYLGKTDDGVFNPLVDFEAAKTATGQIHLIEVYPALALPAMQPAFMERQSAPKYNPKVRKKFSLADWQCVSKTVQIHARNDGLPELAQWAKSMSQSDSPKKPDQDKIDAAICLVIALWIRKGWAKHGLTVIGDRKGGYMVTPTSPETRKALQNAADKRGVWISPAVPAGTG